MRVLICGVIGILPDERWGVIKKTFFAPETLSCNNGSYRNNEGILYEIKNYINKLMADCD